MLSGHFNLSLYAEYIKERQGSDILETKYGFATFNLLGQECYVQDVYVVPEYRKSGVCKALIENIEVIANTNKCQYLTTSVSPVAKNSTDSIKICLRLGFQLFRSDSSLIYFMKRLQ